MIAREYNKQITIYQILFEPNEFAGNNPMQQMLFRTWAKIVTNGVASKFTDFGINEFNDPVIFKCRFRNDLKMQGRTLLIKYKEQDYVIKGVKNVNIADLEVEVYCERYEGIAP